MPTEFYMKILTTPDKGEVLDVQTDSNYVLPKNFWEIFNILPDNISIGFEGKYELKCKYKMHEKHNQGILATYKCLIDLV